MTRLNDRVAIVTGAGDGIGRAIARRYALEGARVVIAERDRTTGELAADEIGAESGSEVVFVRTDVAVRADNEAVVAHAAERWGRLDILVNNAWGGGSIGRVENKTDAAMDAGMLVGFHGPRWAMQAAFPHMKAAGWGRIVNICSLNGVNAHIGTAEYNTAKEALRALSRTAAREWATTGVTVNVICPAALTAAARAVFAANPELKAQAEATNPMGRMGNTDADIAPVALFLASEDSGYVTGNTLFVDGGAHINGVSWAPALPD